MYAKKNGNQDKYGQDYHLPDIGQFETQTLNTNRLNLDDGWFGIAVMDENTRMRTSEWENYEKNPHALNSRCQFNDKPNKQNQII